MVRLPERGERRNVGRIIPRPAPARPPTNPRTGDGDPMAQLRIPSPGAGSSVEERRAAGRSARKTVARTSHGDWSPAEDRDDPIAILERQAESREPTLVPLRHSRMLASAFTFYRGNAAIMAADLAATPSSGLWAQLCGDAHLSNFGGFAAPDRRLVFDVNDFDETLPGPWEWDLKRLVASFEIAGRDRGFARKERAGVVATAVGEYRRAMHRYAEMGNLDLFFERLDLTGVEAEYGGAVSKAERRAFDRNVAKAGAKNRMRALAKLTHRVGGELRIAPQPPLIVPLENLLDDRQARDADERLRAMIDTYRLTLDEAHRRLLDSYHYVHSACKVVGVGSVGTRAWIGLFVGRDEGDPLFLQIKEAQESVLEPFTVPSEHSHHGERVVRGQRMTQAASDIMLGWMTAEGLDGNERHFYVRQLWDAKWSAQVETFSSRQMNAFARLCGSTLARAHARSGDRIAIAGYLGRGTRFDEAMNRFAVAYADQNELDFAALEQAVRDGRVEADGGEG